MVLPFANMSGDPEQEYFSDGITEDLTTDLSRRTGPLRDRTQLGLHLQGEGVRIEDRGSRAGRALRSWREAFARRESAFASRPS